MGNLNVDAAAVAAVAVRIDAVAETLYGLRGAPRFDGRAAGRAHASDGEQIRRGLDGLAGELTGWAGACEAIADELRRGAARYAESERWATGPVSRP